MIGMIAVLNHHKKEIPTTSNLLTGEARRMNGRLKIKIPIAATRLAMKVKTTTNNISSDLLAAESKTKKEKPIVRLDITTLIATKKMASTKHTMAKMSVVLLLLHMSACIIKTPTATTNNANHHRNRDGQRDGQQRSPRREEQEGEQRGHYNDDNQRPPRGRRRPEDGQGQQQQGQQGGRRGRDNGEERERPQGSEQQQQPQPQRKLQRLASIILQRRML
eukprot:TRINITY_DN6754_c0_g1_i1.p1 TRINITY_DN6754_c0_g1~~TRINITY_DN6754_c0_g1_i1.p1  ORF type:complete len:220 (+),score=31.69 TRINITY_DN6754_c0_g1_i1:238-897(+)